MAKSLTERDDVNPVLDGLLHQLRGFVLQAEIRATHILTDPVLAEDAPHLTKELLRIKVLCASASKTLRIAEIFSRLQKGAHFELKMISLKPPDLLPKVTGIMRDALLVSSNGRLECLVDENSFQKAGIQLFADLDLLTQAIWHIAENAIQYSLEDTCIEVFAEGTRSGHFVIGVRNTGLGITVQEASLCKTKGWRGLEAKSVTAQGAGLGLWITDKIMAAMQGELEVRPTTSNAMTEVRLIFPLKRGSR
jgi:signal transduction histidine kinase